jgi:dGTPase
MAKGEESKVEGMILRLFEYYVSNPDALPGESRRFIETDGAERVAVDYISGMTDGYAIETYERLFIPLAWTVK